MRRAFAVAAAGLAVLLAALPARAADLGTVTVGVLKFGTVSWELDVIKAHKLDQKEGFTLEIAEFGNNDAADVALMGDAVNMIVEDFLFASRQRADGVPLSFIPYSSTVGAMMVRPDSGIASLADLEGKKIGVAGGPLDKSWLMVQALAKKEAGIDLATQAEPVYGAPPLLSEKLKQGELDATINYWHFCARLEAEGMKRLIGVDEVQEKLGVPGDTVQLGYIFKEPWAKADPELVQAFSNASRAAKDLLAENDEEWERLRPLTRAENDAVLEALKTRYREGIPEAWGAEQRDAAAKLYDVVAELGGEKLVGGSPVLAEGTFWDGVRY
jgi:NitT/TauT family transport system substrate-binding protein